MGSFQGSLSDRNHQVTTSEGKGGVRFGVMETFEQRNIFHASSSPEWASLRPYAPTRPSLPKPTPEPATLAVASLGWIPTVVENHCRPCVLQVAPSPPLTGPFAPGGVPSPMIARRTPTGVACAEFGTELPTPCVRTPSGPRIAGTPNDCECFCAVLRCGRLPRFLLPKSLLQSICALALSAVV